MAVIDFFDRGWRINPDGVAYIQDDRTSTYRQVGEASCRIANKLLSLGLPKETKGAVWSSNDVTAWSCTLGIWRANMTWLPINAFTAAEQNFEILDAFDCEVMFYQARLADTVAPMRPRLPKIKHWICIDAEGADAPSLQRWLDGQPCTRPEVPYAMDDVVMLAPTGGTTGMPKGVMNTHRSLQSFFIQVLAGAHYAPGEQRVNLAAAPMTHAAGVATIPCSAAGGTVVVVSRPEPALVLDAIAKYRITEVFLPPTVIYRFLDLPGIEQADFSSVKYLGYGSAPMSLDKLKRALKLWGPIMAGGYGQMEAPGSISGLAPQEHLVDGEFASDEILRSVGYPGPLVRVEIQDEHGQILATGQTGEICVMGDLVMKGYYKQPDKTAETIVDGWLHTGDIGHFDPHGRLHITDRKKDMIITGGFNVYPSNVEQVLWSHPAVRDCAVIGVPDEAWGEAVKAVVELNPGHAASAEELIELCKAKLGKVMAPKSVDFVNSLPRSPVGKVLKKDLRQVYWADAQRVI
jgi:acyl-CoA synthetase (AMP-forming)/AMP-acid ligase II